MEPGQFTIPMREYLALPALSSSLCHTLLSQSPAHARWQQAHPKVSNGAMDLGTIVHQILLEGRADGIAVLDPTDFPNMRGEGTATGFSNKAIRAARDEARAAGKIPILSEDMIAVMEMVHAAQTFLRQSELAGIFDRGLPEQTLLWQDGEVWCKARPDWLTNDRSTIIHLKTTQGSAEPNSFIRGPLVNFGYDVAAAFYARALQAVWGFSLSQRHIFLVQECAAPYACSLISLSPAMMEVADAKVTHALSVWADCERAGRWCCYPTKICYAEPRSWQVNEAAELALADQNEPLYERLIEMAGGNT